MAGLGPPRVRMRNSHTACAEAAGEGNGASPSPTLAPPLTMVVNGERKTLVMCMVDDLPEGTADAIWFSNENGSALDSFTYGFSQAEDGTFSTVSHLSVLTTELESWASLACHVQLNKTTQVWSAILLPISEESMGETCPDEDQGALRFQSYTLLLLAIRVLLLKFLLLDVLVTCSFLFRGEHGSAQLKSLNGSPA